MEDHALGFELHGVRERIPLRHEDPVLLREEARTAEALAAEGGKLDELKIPEREHALLPLPGGETDVPPDLAALDVQNEVVVVLRGVDDHLVREPGEYGGEDARGLLQIDAVGAEPFDQHLIERQVGAGGGAHIAALGRWRCLGGRRRIDGGRGFGGRGGGRIGSVFVLTRRTGDGEGGHERQEEPEHIKRAQVHGSTPPSRCRCAATARSADGIGDQPGSPPCPPDRARHQSAGPARLG